MKIVVLAASTFGLRCLKALRQLQCCEIVGVVTAPRVLTISYRPEGVRNILHADFEAYCGDLGIPAVTLETSMSDERLYLAVSSWKPNAFIVAGWYHKVPKRWRMLAPAYGLHASLLPAYSGGAPLVWAMINGESTTGITLFLLDDGVDTGPILDQATTQIT